VYYCGCNQYYYQQAYPYQGFGYDMNNRPCQIFPVPFMPVDPLYAHAYVPYQSFTNTLPIADALMKGTIFPELTTVYNPYEDLWKGER